MTSPEATRQHLVRIVAELSAIAVTVIATVFWGAWWAAALSKQVEDLQRRQTTFERQRSDESALKLSNAVKLARIEENLAMVLKATDGNANRLAAIETYLYTGAKPNGR